MKFKIIACINQSYALGKDNNLLYKIKSDLRNFKRMTKENVVIMGRKTFESLPNGALVDRVNIVISKNPSFKAKDAIVVTSVEDAVRICEKDYPHLEWFVIGGGLIYKSFLDRNLIDTMYLTVVHDETKGDVNFPIFNGEKENFRKFYETPLIKEKESEIVYHMVIFKEN